MRSDGGAALLAGGAEFARRHAAAAAGRAGSARTAAARAAAEETAAAAARLSEALRAWCLEEADAAALLEGGPTARQLLMPGRRDLLLRRALAAARGSRWHFPDPGGMLGDAEALLGEGPGAGEAEFRLLHMISERPGLRSAGLCCRVRAAAAAARRLAAGGGTAGDAELAASTAAILRAALGAHRG